LGTNFLIEGKRIARIGHLGETLLVGRVEEKPEAVFIHDNNTDGAYDPAKALVALKALPGADYSTQALAAFTFPRSAVSRSLTAEVNSSASWRYWAASGWW
jgi:hypothetical protein